jgi:hypothetical protein
MNEKRASRSTHALSVSRPLSIHGAQTFFHSFIRVLSGSNLFCSVPLSMAWIKHIQAIKTCTKATPFYPAQFFFYLLVRMYSIWCTRSKIPFEEKGANRLWWIILTCFFLTILVFLSFRFSRFTKNFFYQILHSYHNKERLAWCVGLYFLYYGILFWFSIHLRALFFAPFCVTFVMSLYRSSTHFLRS